MSSGHKRHCGAVPAEGRARVPYEGGGRRAGHHDNAGVRAAVLLDVYRKLAAAEQQLVDGEPLLNADDVFRRLREKHG